MTSGLGRPRITTKLAFGLGSTAESIATAAIAGFAMFFYNQVLGLPATLAGAAMTAGIAFDGIVDPLIGSISDRTRSRLGRRHPFLLAAPVPVALCLFALFNPPNGLPPLALFAWFLGVVVALRIAMSVFGVPHMALGGELSTDYTERTRVMSYSNFMGAIGTTATAFVALSVFFRATPEHPRGILNPAGYESLSLVAPLACLALYALCAGLTARQIPRLAQPPIGAARFRPGDFLADVRAAFSNRNYLFLLLAVFFLALMGGMRTALSLYVNTFFWGLTSEQIRWFAFTNLVGFFVAFMLAGRLHNRFDKRASMVVCALLVGVVPAMPVLVQMAGWAPPSGSAALVVMLMASGAVYSAVAAVLAISVLSALGDIADENQLRYGIRQEGVLFSTRAVFAKVDSALGAFCAGLAIDLVGLPAKAIPGQVAAHIPLELALIEGPLGVVPALIAAWFYGRYAIDRRSHAETRRQL